MVFTTAEEWLGATVDTGVKKLTLPVAVKSVLAKAFGANIVTAGNV